jgi:hypothetical protein
MYDSYMKSVTYPLAVPPDFLREMKLAAKETGLSTAATIRQSARLGLPKLREQMAGGRVTNVAPLPAKVARALYAQPDDDAEDIRLFMEAQSKAVQE